MYQRTLFVMLCLALTACNSQKLIEGEPWSISSAEILMVGEQPTSCGLLFTTVGVKFLTTDKKTEWAYLPCGIEFAETEPSAKLPSAGMICSANGTVKRGALTVKEDGSGSSDELARHVINMTCENPNYHYRVST